ncbi:MAG: hypothetical protein KGJ36_04470 [Acidobacteriota bacterium]|nr:hypothetical protein [Acidobacteriota bacterium]
MIAIVGGLAGVGFGVAPASATATTGSAAGLEPPISLTIAPGPGVRVTGDCPSSLFQDIGFFDFVSGNYVFYGPSSGNSGGFNVEGDATLTFLGSDSIDAVFEGHTHLWANQNYNPTGNGQQYFGITGSFNGTGIDGTVGSLSITASGGETTSASGHVSGWGHFNVTCSGFPS